MTFQTIPTISTKDWNGLMFLLNEQKKNKEPDLPEPVSAHSAPIKLWQSMSIITEKDIPKIVKFHQAAHVALNPKTSSAPTHAGVDSKYYEKLWASYLKTGRKKGEQAFKLTKEDHVIGFIHFGPIVTPKNLGTGSCVKIHHFYVTPETRNKGYGTTLFNYVLRQTEDAGHNTLLVATSPNDKEAQSFFEKCGGAFVKKTYKRYKDGGKFVHVPSSIFAINLG